MSFEDFRPPSPTPLSPLNNVSTSQTFSNARPRSRSRSFTWSITPRHKRRYSSSSPSPTRQPAQPSKKAAQPSKRAGPASKRAKSFRKDTQDDEIVFTSMGPVVEGGGDSNKNWPAAKKSIVFDFILGINADDRFNLFKKAPGKIFAKAAPLTGKTATQCQSMFQRARQLYNRIHAFLRVTGGGGDGDEDKIDDNFDFDDDDKIAELLDKAKANGKDVAGINAKLLREWKEHGWLDLFESRYGKNPKTERNYALSSAMPISPAKSIKELEVEEEPATPVIKTEPTNAAQVVAEHRFTPAQRIRNSSQDLMGGINDYFRTRAQVDEGVAQRKEKRFEYKQFKDRVEWAQNLLKDDTISTEQRTRLHKIILDALEA
ncbi:hypothetical protein F5878DRAFT_664854 [Lentinula raphanica]|uniref:Uncharacterized protein n=1 Tax=Lentinula raphanica TaxID=153919 RepID=A0AA38P146_9AGAR|nr:hypothetical protein F5878DRAFT_664854 [Lentinula raphanica]